MWRKLSGAIVMLVAVLGVIMLFNSSQTPEDVVLEDPLQAGRDFFEPVPIPEKLTFAGEEVPIHYFDVRESLDRELLVNSYFHSQTLRLLKLAPRYFPIIEPILKENGIPDDFKYLAVAESAFNERAVSPAGAAGFWQFLSRTATDYGLEVNAEVDERYHLEKATVAACKYLNESYARYSNWAMVAASYNAGRAAMDRHMTRQKETSYYDLLLVEETTRYVFRILALKLIMEDPEKYGFRVREKDKYPMIPMKIVEVNGPVNDFAEFAQAYGINYKILKMFNPWLRDTFIKNPSRKTYQIKIPAEGYRTLK